MNPFQHIDAIAAAFFGLLAIWATVVRRHWFLRLAVVGGILLTALLIPAYDAVIEFGVQIGLIVIVLWFARGREQWKPRLSLETALLVTVVVAVAAAVYARLPDFQWSRWTALVINGLVAGYLALVCLWIVAGRARLRWRIAVGLVAIIAAAPMLHFATALIYGIEEWQVGRDGWLEFKRFYDREYFRRWLPNRVPMLAYGCALFIGVLLLARASGWFDEQNATPPSSRRRQQIAARVALIGVILFIASPITYLLFRLTTPPPLPSTPPPLLNGYDDFLAAGRAAPLNLLTRAQQVFAAKEGDPVIEQAEAELESLQPVFDQIDAGMQRESAVDLRVLADSTPQHREERKALRAAEEALWLQYVYRTKRGTPAAQAESLFQIIDFVNKSYRGSGITWLYRSSSGDTVGSIVYTFGYTLPKFDAVECRDIAQRLYQLDQTREPWEEQVRVERLIDSRKDWRLHLRNVLSDLGGWHPYDWRRPDWLHNLEEHRSVMMAYATRAYCLEHHRTPPNAAALVPKFLPAVPEDPYDGQPMKLKSTSQTVTIYSVGKNRVDDGGVPHPIDRPKGWIHTDQGDSARVLNAVDLGLETTNSTKPPQ